ncbi:MAG: M23 family metallopeptidase [Flavobacteriales bacterium]|nr:M23 family metallopeptidase [Flavobacteriales bacterium]
MNPSFFLFSMHGFCGLLNSRALWVGILLCGSATSWGQDSLRSRTELIAPLSIPLVLAGNFGELRPDHFHTGLDFKTQGREGFPVLAAADGVVARVKVSPVGYGRAVYMNSPNGLTTVYAHLRRFSPALETWILKEQYRLERFSVDLFPKRAFAFQQGDTLGWSGNSGSSGGPHLHFEVRETATERPINPLLWDFPVEDHVAPQLDALWVLPMQGAEIQGKSRPFRAVHQKDTLKIAGEVRFAAEAMDRLDAANNRCGVYGLAVNLDGEPWFSWRIDTLDFSVNRDMNAHAYYPVWAREGSQVHRLHRLPGNRLPVYRSESMTNALVLTPGESAEIQVVATDIHGNQTERTWWCKGVEQSVVEPLAAKGSLYPYNQKGVVQGASGGRVQIPSYAFYEDYGFELNVLEGGRWLVGDPGQPARKSLTVRLPLPSDTAFGREVPNGVWLAAVMDESGEVDGVYTGEVSGSEFVFETKTCGTYELRQDTVPPQLTPQKQHLSAGEPDVLRMGSRSELRFNTSDALSGIKKIQGQLDGEWILIRWDPKRERIWYELGDERHAKGARSALYISVEDAVGNETTWSGWVQFP